MGLGLNGASREGNPELDVNTRFRVPIRVLNHLNIYLTYRQHTLLSTVGRVPVDEMDLPQPIS
jgi:hypothetical protein